MTTIVKLVPYSDQIAALKTLVTGIAANVDQKFTSGEKAKLAGIAAGATANDTDDNLKNRANHTGTQQISTVEGLAGELSGKASAAQGAKADTALQPGTPISTVAGLEAALANTATAAQGAKADLIDGDTNNFVTPLIEQSRDAPGDPITTTATFDTATETEGLDQTYRDAEDNIYAGWGADWAVFGGLGIQSVDGKVYLRGANAVDVAGAEIATDPDSVTRIKNMTFGVAGIDMATDDLGRRSMETPVILTRMDDEASDRTFDADDALATIHTGTSVEDLGVLREVLADGTVRESVRGDVIWTKKPWEKSPRIGWQPDPTIAKVVIPAAAVTSWNASADALWAAASDTPGLGIPPPGMPSPGHMSTDDAAYGFDAANQHLGSGLCVTGNRVWHAFYRYGGEDLIDNAFGTWITVRYSDDWTGGEPSWHDAFHLTATKPAHTGELWSFAESAIGPFVGANADFAGTDGGAVLTSTAADPQLIATGLTIDGEAYPHVIANIQRMTARTSGTFDGRLYWSTAEHDFDVQYSVGCGVTDLPVDTTSRVNLHFDVTTADEYADWRDNEVTGLRFDFDDGPGGSFRLGSIKVASDYPGDRVWEPQFIHDRKSGQLVLMWYTRQEANMLTCTYGLRIANPEAAIGPFNVGRPWFIGLGCPGQGYDDNGVDILFTLDQWEHAPTQYTGDGSHLRRLLFFGTDGVTSEEVEHLPNLADVDGVDRRDFPESSYVRLAGGRAILGQRGKVSTVEGVNCGYYVARYDPVTGWTDPEPYTALGVSTNSRFLMRSLPNGLLAIVHNAWSTRRWLTLSLSGDEGATWPRSVRLWDDITGTSATYPAGHWTADGSTFLCAFEVNREDDDTAGKRMIVDGTDIEALWRGELGHLQVLTTTPVPPKES